MESLRNPLLAYLAAQPAVRHDAGALPLTARPTVSFSDAGTPYPVGVITAATPLAPPTPQHPRPPLHPRPGTARPGSRAPASLRSGSSRSGRTHGCHDSAWMGQRGPL